MTDQDRQFIESLPPKKRYWWELNIEKHGSVEAVKQAMSAYSSRRKTIVGFKDPETLRKAQETIKRNRK